MQHFPIRGTRAPAGWPFQLGRAAVLNAAIRTKFSIFVESGLANTAISRSGFRCTPDFLHQVLFSDFDLSRSFGAGVLATAAVSIFLECVF